MSNAFSRARALGFAALGFVCSASACAANDGDAVPEGAGSDSLSDAGVAVSHENDGTYRIKVGSTPYELRLLSDTTFRIRDLRTLDEPTVPELMVVSPDDARPAVNASIGAEGARTTVTTTGMKLMFDTNANGALRVNVVRGDRAVIEDWVLDAQHEQSAWTLRAGERIHGFGDKRAAIDQRGQNLVMLNHDAFASTTNDSYKSIPFFWSTKGYGAFFHNYFPSTFDIGKKKSDELALTPSEGRLDFYVFVGDQPADVIDAYTELTGRPAMLPRWFFGFHQAKAAYEGRDAFTVAKKMRDEHLPVDVIYYDDWVDEAVTKPFIDDLWAQYRVRLTVGGNPFAIGDSPFMQRLAAQGHLMVDARGKAVIEPAEEIADDDGNADDVGYVDFFSPAATTAFFAEEWQPAIANGVILGMADFGEMDHLADPTHRSFPSVGLSVARGRNLYGLAYTNAMTTAAQAASGKRMTGMVRPGFAGTQRLGWTTTGDSEPTYANFRAHVRALLNLTLSGFSNVGYDIGGWDHKGPDTLYARWFAAATFNPFMWAHGQGDHEPYAHGATVESAARAWLELRYRLVPYFYSLHEQAHRTGLPILRAFALALAEQGDGTGALSDDQFFVGDGLLVAPLFNDAGSRRVYLPRGTWYDFFGVRAPESGERFIDIGATPITRAPVFVRAGTVIPMGPTMQSTGAAPLDPLSIHFYAWPASEVAGGPRTASFSLYEDDGESRAYESGAFQRTVLDVEQGADYTRVTVTPTSGDGSYRSVARRSCWLELHGLSAAGLTRVTLGGVEIVKQSQRASVAAGAASAWGTDGEAWVYVDRCEDGAIVELR